MPSRNGEKRSVGLIHKVNTNVNYFGRVFGCALKTQLNPKEGESLSL